MSKYLEAGKYSMLHLRREHVSESKEIVSGELSVDPIAGNSVEEAKIIIYKDLLLDLRRDK